MSRAATGHVDRIPAREGGRPTAPCEHCRAGVAHWRVRISLADGGRPWIHIRPEVTSEALAKEKALFHGDKARREARTSADYFEPRKARGSSPVTETNPPVGETVTDWFDRHFDAREARGLTSIGDERYRFNVWIKPHMGAKAMRDVTADDVEDVRDALDRAIRDWTAGGMKRGTGLAPKSASNVWSVLVSGFREARTAKLRELRVLPAGHPNPCDGVQAPERGESRRKTFVFPTEFLALASCEAVPLAWREVHAVAAYTYLRPGELRVLTWADVDEKHGIISVTKAWDYRKAEIKDTKTGAGVREVPVEAALTPLLKRMREGKGSGDAVLPLLSAENEDTLAETTRQHLKLAGVERPALTDDTTTTLRANFRSWRDSGITWLALAGVDLAKMQRRAGHENIATTLGYVKLAEDLRGRVGAPFPTLPEALVKGSAEAPPGGGEPPANRPAIVWETEVSSESFTKTVRRKGLEPLQELPRQNLNLVRLPIPPPSRGEEGTTRTDPPTSSRARAHHYKFSTLLSISTTKL